MFVCYYSTRRDTANAPGEARASGCSEEAELRQEKTVPSHCRLRTGRGERPIGVPTAPASEGWPDVAETWAGCWASYPATPSPPILTRRSRLL